MITALEYEAIYEQREEELAGIKRMMEGKQYASPGAVCGFVGCNAKGCYRSKVCPYRLQAPIPAVDSYDDDYLSRVRSVAGSKGKGKRRGARLRLG
ncbi:MAG: hypothetical protein PHT33_03945 [bacterium]|nr:hypothetical protein [bacterium]